MTVVAVRTHRGREDTSDGLRELIVAAREAGDVTLQFDSLETRKNGLIAGPGVEVDTPLSGEVDLCIVLGGDGTILSALRELAGTSVPVFAVNYGYVGFLSTVSRDRSEFSFRQAFELGFDTLALPTIEVGRPDGSWAAINDISVQRRTGSRVADLAYALGGEEIGRVRCDGLVVSTPAGSTGYNLANGGPVLAWGVRGYVVSFIAPHSLTARALVAAPEDVLTIHNTSREETVDIQVDGRPVSELPAGQDLCVTFGASTSLLAQIPGSTFYNRLRERFGRLAH